MTRTMLAMVALTLSMAFSAAALVQSGELGKTEFTVYAPDWTWQKQDINILVVFENTTAEPVERKVELIVPEAYRDHFGHWGAASIPVDALVGAVTVPAHATARTAITGITALHGFPLQEYPLEVCIVAEETPEERRIAFALQTIRGAAVNPGKWALYLPVGVALAFCLVFALVISRFAVPGAWKRASAPLTEPTDVPAWVHEEP
ncbi:MAG: hypothetical protein R6V12_03830 [Candidatus Hydrogenedentota bacterium]